MKEIVIMVGPAGPDQRLINMLRQLFPECAIRFVRAGSKHVTMRGDAKPMDLNNPNNKQKTDDPGNSNKRLTSNL